jgi:hypothetical protein
MSRLAVDFDRHCELSYYDVERILYNISLMFNSTDYYSRQRELRMSFDYFKLLAIF